ncbi:MAG TPA: PilZ domain-containing protein [Rhizomicrobium sp.]|jgi:hypothetical protein|nr:PilZ domain-containing protein [Rhizomicrobium sp.]
MPPNTATSHAIAGAQEPAERRRFRRVKMDIPGRLFTPGDSREGDCTIINMSPGGAALRAEFTPPAGTPVVVYIDGFGRFEGQVSRIGKESFGVRFGATAMKRERIAEQLTVFINRGLVDESSLRRHDRNAAQGMMHFTRADGSVVPCEVLDLSLSGVSVKTDVKPPIGEFVLIGQMAGRIARLHENGVGIEFVAVPHDKAQAERLSKIAVVR